MRFINLRILLNIEVISSLIALLSFGGTRILYLFYYSYKSDEELLANFGAQITIITTFAIIGYSFSNTILKFYNIVNLNLGHKNQLFFSIFLVFIPLPLLILFIYEIDNYNLINVFMLLICVLLYSLYLGVKAIYFAKKRFHLYVKNEFLSLTVHVISYIYLTNFNGTLLYEYPLICFIIQFIAFIALSQENLKIKIPQKTLKQIFKQNYKIIRHFVLMSFTSLSTILSGFLILVSYRWLEIEIFNTILIVSSIFELINILPKILNYIYYSSISENFVKNNQVLNLKILNEIKMIISLSSIIIVIILSYMSDFIFVWLKIDMNYLNKSIYYFFMWQLIIRLNFVSSSFYLTATKYEFYYTKLITAISMLIMLVSNYIIFLFSVDGYLTILFIQNCLYYLILTYKKNSVLKINKIDEIILFFTSLGLLLIGENLIFGAPILVYFTSIIIRSSIK